MAPNQQALDLKDTGAAFFRAGKFETAAEQYEGALAALKSFARHASVGSRVLARQGKQCSEATVSSVDIEKREVDLIYADDTELDNASLSSVLLVLASDTEDVGLQVSVTANMSRCAAALADNEKAWEYSTISFECARINYQENDACLDNVGPICTALYLRGQAHLAGRRIPAARRDCELALQFAGLGGTGLPKVAQIQKLVKTIDRTVTQTKNDNKRMAKEISKWLDSTNALEKMDC